MKDSLPLTFHLIFIKKNWGISAVHSLFIISYLNFAIRKIRDKFGKHYRLLFIVVFKSCLKDASVLTKNVETRGKICHQNSANILFDNAF